MVTLVTSMNQRLYDAYGREMIASFEARSLDVRLVVVFEGDIPSLPLADSPLVTVIRFESEEYDRFHRFFGRLEEARGIRIFVDRQAEVPKVLASTHSYKFDLIRFSFKIFALAAARSLMASGEPFAWIDADVRCLAPFSAADLAPFFPDPDQIMSYLGRTAFPIGGAHSECGFLGFNPAHPQTSAFLDRMKALYVTGEAFSFREWHDSWLWDDVRQEFECAGHGFKNLSGEAETLENPFMHTGLGRFFDHLKGDAGKVTGRSDTQADLAVQKYAALPGANGDKPVALAAYGCGSPIRLPVVEAMAEGSGAQPFVPGANPNYLGGDSIVWGLIRGAPALMQATRDAGRDFFQIDNAYFGRERYFRVTRNALQITEVGDRDPGRLRAAFSNSGLKFNPWKTKRNGPIVVCPSSEHLFGFYNTTLQRWLDETMAKIRAATDRPITVRMKNLQGTYSQLADAWCVVTHVSAAGLDALRLGVPVVTTGTCAATPLSTPIDQIENPLPFHDREPLFATLAWSQFTVAEMRSGLAWSTVSGAG